MAEPKRMRISQGASQCSFTTATTPNPTLTSASNSGSAPIPTPTQIAQTLTSTLTSASIPPSIAKQCNRYWSVDIIDDQGVTREGRLKVHEVWSLPTSQRIVVPFSAQGQEAIGEAAGLLGGFLRIVGTDLTTFPISYRAWCQIPHSYKDTCFDIIKAKFCLDHNIQKHFVLKKLGQNWRNYRVYLFQKYYDDTKSREANLPNHPNFIPRDMWVALVDSELSTQEMSRMNCQNRKEKVDDLRQEVARLRSELHTSNQLLHSELQLLKKQQEDMRVAVIYVFQNLVGDVPPQFAHLLNP